MSEACNNGGVPGKFGKLLLCCILFLFPLAWSAAQSAVPARIQLANIERLIESGVLSEAARQLESYLAQFPHDHSARRMIIGLYRELAEHNKVFEQAQILLNARPNDAEALAWADEARRAIAIIYPERMRRYRTLLERNPRDHVTRRALVELMVQHGDIREAIIEFRIIMEDDPENLELQLHLARMHAWGQFYEDAVVLYRNYLQAETDPVLLEQAQFELAAILAWSGQAGTAARMLMRMVERNPDNLSAKGLLADLYRWNDDSDIAEHLYREILAVDPLHQRALAGMEALEELRAARALQAERLNISAMERRMRANPDDQEARLQLARLLGVDGRYPEAEPLFREYLRRSPDAHPVRRELALALGVQERYEEAIEQLQLYLQHFPDDIGVRTQLANLFIWKGDTLSAEAVLLDLVVIMPEMLDLHWSLARLLQANQKWDEALHHYRFITQMDPHYFAPHVKIRQIQNHPGYRILSLERRVQSNPRDVEARIELAQNYLALERFFEAMDNILAASALAPGNARILQLETTIRAELMAFRERQLRAMLQRLEEAPDDHETRLQLAQTYKATERFPEARREFEIYLAAHPDDYDALREYAQLLSWDPASRREAMALYTRLLHRFPDDLEVRMHFLQLRIWTDTADQRDFEDIVRLRRRLEDRMASHPNDVANLLNLAALHELQDRLESAVAVYRRVLSIDRSNQQALQGIRGIESLPQYRMAQMRRAVEQNPRSIALRLELARFAFETGQYFDALSQAEAILGLDRSHVEANWLANNSRERLAALRQRQISDLRNRLRNDPRDAEARLELARMLRSLNNYSEAARQFSFYLRIVPDDHAVRREYAQILSWQPDTRDQALAETLALIESFPDDESLRIQLLQLRSWSNLSNQDDRREILAMRLRLEDALLFDPYDLEAKFNLAGLNELQERWQSALSIYRSILTDDPDNERARQAITAIHNLPDFRIANMREQVAQNPREVAPRLVLARFLLQQGRLFDASEEAKAILTLDSRNNEAREIERSATLQVERQRGDRLRALRDLIREDPLNLAHHLEMGQLLRDEGLYVEALRRYRMYLRVHPQDMQVRREFAQMLSWTGENFDQAVVEFRELIDFFPDDVGLRLEYARLLMQNREHWREAESELQELTLFDPGNLEIPVLLADLYRFQGRFPEARAIYQDVVEMTSVNWFDTMQGARLLSAHPLQHSHRRPVPSERSIWLSEDDFRGGRLNVQPLPGLETEYEAARQGLLEIRRALRPQLSAFIGFLLDNEDFGEWVAGARFTYFRQTGTAIYIGVNFQRAKEEGGDPENLRMLGGVLGVSGRMAPRLTGVAELRGQWYSGDFRKNTFGGLLAATYQATPNYNATLSYAKFDAIQEVKTVRSLAAGITVDRFAFDWTSNPAYSVENQPFWRRVFLDARASYASFSDSNRQTMVLLRPYYRLRQDPTIDFALGWSTLSYSRESPFYWSPSSHSGPFMQVRIAGEGIWSINYDVRAEIMLPTSAGTITRSISAAFTRALGNDFTAGLSLSASETPREEEEIYRSGSIFFDIFYRF